MKIILCAVNSAYYHKSLTNAILLRELEKSSECVCTEFSINQSITQAVESLYELRGDIYMFSCYIWNIEFIRKVVSDLKKVTKCVVILGGSEVSYSPRQILASIPETDYAVCGEAEAVIERVAAFISLKQNPDYLPNVYSHRTINKSPLKTHFQFSSRIFPYDEDYIRDYEDKIIYYESMRGCPYSCTYCLSSAEKRLSFISAEQTESELMFFINKKVKQVKFTDRTFNADAERAKQIIRFITENNICTNFHLEMRLDIMDDEMISLLCSAPAGYFQIEAGLQSANPLTLAAVHRDCDNDRFRHSLEKLREPDNIHIHTDLIAMLPEETLRSFLSAFDFLYELRPHTIQIGFLKLLKGTALHAEAEMHGLIQSDYPPYEVLSSSTMTHREYNLLKKFEVIVKRCVNSGFFGTIFSRLISDYEMQPHALVLLLINHYSQHDLFRQAQSADQLFRTFSDFLRKHKIPYDSVLAFDYLKNVSLILPDFLSESVKKLSGTDTADFIRANSDYLKSYESLKDLTEKQIFRKISVYKFDSLFSDECLLFIDEQEKTASGQKKHAVLQNITTA